MRKQPDESGVRGQQLGRGQRYKTTDDTVHERRCIATQCSFPKRHLIRFVLSPANVITPDILNRLPGRGIWVLSDRSKLKKVVTQNLFNKAAKKSVIVPEDLPELTESLIVKHLLELISMARKSGQAICGYEKTKSMMISDLWHILLQAHDGSVSQKRKIRSFVKDNSYISCLTSQEMGLAFGRENVIHAAVTKGGLSERILLEANRLVGFREQMVVQLSQTADYQSAAKG